MTVSKETDEIPRGFDEESDERLGDDADDFGEVCRWCGSLIRGEEGWIERFDGARWGRGFRCGEESREEEQ